MGSWDLVAKLLMKDILGPQVYYGSVGKKSLTFGEHWANTHPVPKKEYPVLYEIDTLCFEDSVRP